LLVGVFIFGLPFLLLLLLFFNPSVLLALLLLLLHGRQAAAGTLCIQLLAPSFHASLVTAHIDCMGVVGYIQC
jgi:hypothetical protein